MENKTINILKITILSIIAVVLICILLVLLNKDFTWKMSSKSTQLMYDEKIEEAISKVDIHTYTADVEIKNSSDGSFRVKIYSEKETDIEVNVQDTLLQIEDTNRHICFGFCLIETPKIVIEVPEENDYKYVINGVSSDINIESPIEKITLKTVSGDVNLNTSKEANIKTTSGDITIEEGQSLTIETVSGDININTINKECKINTTSGDIEIRRLFLARNSSIKSVSGDVEVTKTENVYIDAKTTSGDIDIEKNNRHSEFELKIETVSGDIEVNN